MLGESEARRVYLACGSTDLRKSIDGLVLLGYLWTDAQLNGISMGWRWFPSVRQGYSLPHIRDLQGSGTMLRPLCARRKQMDA